MSWWLAVGYGIAAYIVLVIIPFALAVRHGEQRERRDRAARRARHAAPHVPHWARTDQHRRHP